MAAEALGLDPAREAAGAKLLELTDQVDFNAYAAAWVRDRDASTWLYVLISPMVDTQGPKWVYERLLRVFRARPLPEEISPLEIHVLSPSYEAPIFGSSIIGVGGPPGVPVGGPSIFEGTSIDGVLVGGGFAAIYRRLQPRDRKRNPAEWFDKGVRQLEVA